MGVIDSKFKHLASGQVMRSAKFRHFEIATMLPNLMNNAPKFGLWYLGKRIVEQKVSHEQLAQMGNGILASVREIEGRSAAAK